MTEVQTCALPIGALRSSLNTVFAQLSMEMGAHRVVSMARRLGIRSTIQRVNSNILGTSNTTMLDMVTAYHTLANRGVTIAPRYVTRIAPADGTTLWSWTREQSPVLDARPADQVTPILAGAASHAAAPRAQPAASPSARHPRNTPHRGAPEPPPPPTQFLQGGSHESAPCILFGPPWGGRGGPGTARLGVGRPGRQDNWQQHHVLGQCCPTTWLQTPPSWRLK